MTLHLNGRVTVITDQPTNTADVSFTSDDAGRITSMTDARQGQSTWSTAYTHDNVGRLLSENRTGGASGNFATSYAYDAQGNRTQVVRNGSTFAYGAASDNDRFTTGEGYSFGSYDNDGNPLSVAVPGGATWTFVYDEESRPLSVTRGSSGTTTYRYDGEGRRVERAYSGSTTRYGWDGETEILETNGSNVVTLHRLPGVGVVKSGTQTFSQEDALGSSTIERSASGTLLATVRQDGYGREIFRSGASASDYGWGGTHGYVTDPESGMVLMNARFYLPAIGRFLTQDPIGHAGGLNLYAYCDNGPLTRFDPDGKTFQKLHRSAQKVRRYVSSGWNSWGESLRTTGEFFAGSNQTDIHYPIGHPMSLAMENSLTGSAIEAKIRGTGFMPKKGWMRTGAGKSHVAFMRTLLQSWNGAQAQAVAVDFFAKRYGNTVQIHVYQDVSLNSFLYHATAKVGLPPHLPSGAGITMGTIRQHYYWNMKIK